jgi:(heptosyl)LPS beta-1,4-glucosyltransferase
MTITALTVVSKVDSLEYLQRSIESYQEYVDEVIVANNNMSTEQFEYIKKTKARVIDIENVSYVELAREQLHEHAKSEYILVIDPDEIISGGLIDELKKYAQNYDYIRIPRKNIIFGQWIQHSRWWPDYQLRFFKKGSVEWSKKLHSVPITHGQGFDLLDREENAMVHHNYESVDHFISKMTRYAKAEATEKILPPISIRAQTI